MIDAHEAWAKLKGGECIGVGTCNGRVQCFLRRDGGIECDVSEDSDSTAVLQESEFSERFRHSSFTEIDTGSV